MAKRRVVITGMGMITPLGKTVAGNWEKLLAGESGIGRITAFDPSAHKSQIAGEVRNFAPEEDLADIVPKKGLKKMDRLMHFSLFAANAAVNDARLDLEKLDRTKIGVCMGVGGMGLGRLSEEIKILLEKGPARVSPFIMPATIASLAAGQISIAFGLQGFNQVITSACASGSHAIGEGLRSIQRGESDIVLAGGAEALIVPVFVAGFENMGVLSTRWNNDPQRAPRPFDRNRDGFVMAEGSGILVLEELKHALKRNVIIYAELAGFARTSGAYHITDPDIEGQKRCMRLAVQDAGAALGQIGHINAHATATVSGDPKDVRAIKELFDSFFDKIFVSATKSMTGHLIGAAGAIEAAYTVLSLTYGIIPPTINTDNPDPECNLNYAGFARKVNNEYALSNSSGFGDTNGCLVFKKFPRATLK